MARSDMTAQDFVNFVGALGGSYKEVGKLVGRSPTAMSFYATGKMPVPQKVKDKLLAAWKTRQAELLEKYHKNVSTVEEMIIAGNELKQELAKPAGPRLMNRAATPDTTTYPIYRIDAQRVRVYLSALNGWAIAMRDARRQAGTEQALHNYDLELADIQSLAGFARSTIGKGAPYDFCITKTEWDVVSRALRHAQTSEAYALYQHWRIHKASGYPTWKKIECGCIVYTYGDRRVKQPCRLEQHRSAFRNQEAKRLQRPGL